MKRAKSILGRMLSVLMALVLTFVMSFVMPQNAEAASSPKGYVTVSMEKFTLGLGYIIEPVRVPIYEGDTGAKVITRLIDENLGKGSYEYTGSIGNQSGVVGQTFYLASVRDKDKRDAKIPKYILDVCDEPYGRDRDEWLGEFDYTFMSGWMYAVNNWFPNYGSGSYKLKDGDVMRWQYTVWGYGADLGSTFMSDDGGTDALIDAANKDDLTTAVAKINSSDMKEHILQDKNVKSAYNKAYRVLQDMESKQSEVNATLATLNKALDNAKKPKILSPNKIVDQEYTGKEIKPSVTVKDGNKTLKLGTDYKVSYSDNKNVGSATVTVTGIGNYEGYIGKAKFKIVRKKEFSVYSISDKSYTGKEIKPTVTVKDGSKTLKLGTDYTVSYSNNKNIGSAIATVTGKNSYKGFSKKVTFKIEPRKVKNVKATSTTSSVKLTWDKVSEATGYRIYRYNSKTKSYDYISKVAKNSTTYYTNSKRSSATSYTYKVRAYKTVSGKIYYGNFSDSKKITTKPLTPSIKLSTGSKKIKVSWNKISGSTGYEVYRATSKSGKYSKIKTVTKGSTLSYTNIKLSKGQTYYYKVKAYKTVDGKKVYSSYSSVKYAKAK
ncbi:MAG: DUF4430 domain-containing protein [Terrisporobacter othiniensis]|uniref:DUF4430 domain-containing protein n=1 Tax=Terrisporobacter othiniensis TaxID=1577792 RepID=UPI0029150924|nr:DUF4430 domain-containing protein [Terrisporobacter othiniensis]MDU6985059.1 DUF4430 domain-containing protein [Terrisporobacter othiniensis]